MREAFKEDHTGEGINKDTVAKPVRRHQMIMVHPLQSSL